MRALVTLSLAGAASQGGVTFVDLADQNPEPSLAWLILTTFLFIGVLLLLSIGFGASLGVFRIWLRRRFPGNRLNGPEAEAFTRLHLEPPARASRASSSGTH